MQSLQEESASDAVVVYSKEALGSLVEKVAGQEAGDAWRDSENDPWPLFPEKDDEEDEDKDSYMDNDDDDDEEESDEEDSDSVTD